MKIVVCQLPGSLPEAAPGLVLFEIGVEGEDHWLLQDSVETICGWLLGKPNLGLAEDLPPRPDSVPVLDDADRIVIQKIYVEMAPLNNVVINVSARLDDIERMVNGLVDILEMNSWFRRTEFSSSPTCLVSGLPVGDPPEGTGIPASAELQELGRKIAGWTHGREPKGNNADE